MKILAVDDEKLALASLTDAIRAAEPAAELYACQTAAAALELERAQMCGVAFVDIRLRGVSGLELALRLKSINPKINIIFATGYDEYALPAMRQHCSGYLLKPVQAEDVRAELDNLRFEPEHGRIYAQTFGNFELFVDGAPAAFESARAKELLAYLIDRRGAAVSSAEAAAAIWERSDNLFSAQTQVRKAKTSLAASLAAAGAGEILLTVRGGMAVDAAGLECDYWQLLAGDTRALNSFMGEYMAQYSWAEATRGALLLRTENKPDL